LTEPIHSVSYDLSDAMLAPVVIDPCSGFEAALNEYPVPFAKMFIGEFCQLSPQDDRVPLRSLVWLAFLVLVDFRSGQRKLGHRFSSIKPSGFRIPPEATNEHDFVQARHEVQSTEALVARKGEKSSILHSLIL
jgi:hypothetical protein